MSGMLFQIEAKQKRLQEIYASNTAPKTKLKNVIAQVINAPAEVPVEVPVVESVSLEALIIPKEKHIAVTLPISMHAQADLLMANLKFTGTKKDFFYLVIKSAFEVLQTK